MENCLVTKLKSVVNNNNLRYFDAVKIIFRCDLPSAPNYMALPGAGGYLADSNYIGGVGVVIKPLSNCHVINSLTSGLVEVDGQYVCEETSYNIAISPINPRIPAEFLLVGLAKIDKMFNQTARSYRQIDKLYVQTTKYISNLTDVTELSTYSTNDENNSIDYIKDLNINKSVVTSIWWTAVDGARPKKIDLSIFREYPNCKTITPFTNSTIVEGNLSDLQHVTSLTQLPLNSKNVVGNIEDLGRMVNLTALGIYGTPIKGTIESLVSGLVSNGKKTGSLDLNPNNIITFKGNTLAIYYHYTVAWTSASDITVTKV